MLVDPSTLGLVLSGCLVGLVVGVTGMGGGALLTPLLVLGFGVPARVAVSSDLVVSLLMKPVGAVTHHRQGTVRPDLVRWLAVGSVPAAFVGAATVNIVLDHRGASALEVLIGGTLLVASALMVVRMVRRLGSDRDTSVPVPVRPAITVGVGVLGGLLVGLTSVGSGSLMLVLLAVVYPALSGSTLVGTDLAQAVPLVASAALGHVLFGQVDVALVLPLVAGALPCVWLGARAATRIPDRVLRSVLATLLAGSGLKLIGVV